MVLIWFIGIIMLVLGNILYFKNFDDAICGSAYCASGNLNQFVWDILKSNPGLVGLMILLVCVEGVVTFFASKNTNKVGRRFITLYIIATLLMFAGQMSLSVRRISIFNNLDCSEAMVEYRTSFNLRTNWKSYIMDYGIPGYIARVIHSNIYHRYTASEQDINHVLELLHSNKQFESQHLTSCSSLNRQKNLILIIVESLNSKVLRLKESEKIAPLLSALTGDSTVLYFPSIEAMTTHGRSSDAQFMVNTGILPLRDEAVVTRYADADYPSLAKTLGFHSLEIIGEEKSLWSHGITTKSYGFERLIDDVVPHGTPKGKIDSLIFDRAKMEIQSIRQPFYMQITTLGMHKPYTDEVGGLLLNNDDYVQTDRCYLEVVHAFDLSCSDFLEYLKRIGLYDNSIIIIVSDHEEAFPNLSDLFNEKVIPMFIINSSLLSKRDYSKPFLQIDIYPTILDIMGYSGDNYFQGVGKSMLDSSKPRAIPINKAFEISEKLIKSKILLDTVVSSFHQADKFEEKSFRSL